MPNATTLRKANPPKTPADAPNRCFTPPTGQVAFSQFIEEVYAELRHLAHAHMRREQPGHTLQTTALVHEVYLRLANCKGVSVTDRQQFFSLASRVMRHILVDYARAATSAKRGAGNRPAQLDGQWPAKELPIPEILALHEALQHLEAHDPHLGRVFELHAFGGLTNQEIATTLGVSLRTANRNLALSRAWMQRLLNGAGRRLESSPVAASSTV
ncbi:sigma-70 family RNA polymerase sigma factor [Chloracidobacterium validum]|uniref:Sigma-70 family RNA polymerase sigma factor n=1 Tax=Chloracidobacterium validum TaxID=2821543 RepID=A0ABX8BF72_9BACT|nr:ECF-type sigma factor [Chloracidobacterium validum]QUW04319.1 sigma-70 family RNA polymerase sigma factor [Chloracidobacterium validum]